MAKAKASTVFFCQNCGYEACKMAGTVSGHCHEWNTFVEETDIRNPPMREVFPVQREGAGQSWSPASLRILQSGRRTVYRPESGNWTGCWEAVW